MYKGTQYHSNVKTTFCKQQQIASGNKTNVLVLAFLQTMGIGTLVHNTTLM